MAHCLQTLPSELLEQIAECFTSPEDWSALRLTCSSIQYATRRSWAKAFFTCLEIPFDVDYATVLTDLLTPDLALTATEIEVPCPNDLTVMANISRLLEFTQSLVILLQKLTRAEHFWFFTLEHGKEPTSEEFQMLSGRSIFFDAVLYAVRTAGVQPKSVHTALDAFFSNAIGSRDGTGLSHMHGCCSQLEELSIDLLLRTEDRQTTFDGRQFGRQISSSCNGMQALRTLQLHLDDNIEAENVFHEFAKSAYLPCLELLNVCEASFPTSALVRLLHRHLRTLKGLRLNSTKFSEPGRPRVHMMLEEIRDFLELDTFILNNPFVRGGAVCFNGLDELEVGMTSDDENEDGCVEIYTMPAAILTGREEVVEYIPRMLSSIMYDMYET